MSYQLTEAFSDDVMSLAVSSLLCYSTLIVDNRIVRKSRKDDWVSALLLYLLAAMPCRRTPSQLSQVFHLRSDFGRELLKSSAQDQPVPIQFGGGGAYRRPRACLGSSY